MNIDFGVFTEVFNALKKIIFATILKELGLIDWIK